MSKYINSYFEASIDDFAAQIKKHKQLMRSDSKILCEALENGHKKITTWLVERRVGIDGKDSDGWTPLHYAVAYNDTKLVQALLDAGADAKRQNWEGERPHELTTARTDPKIVEALYAAIGIDALSYKPN